MTSSTKPEPLLPRIAAGDLQAVTECLDRYGGLVWSIVRRSLKDHAQAEDVVQEVFISLWKAAAAFNPERASESAFVSTIARRRLIDRHRSMQRQPQLDSIEDVVVSAEDAALQRVDLDDEAGPAIAALQQLKPEQRKFMEMWFVGGMTHSEIATSTGVPLGTVKSQIRRGILRARELLQPGPYQSSEATA